MLNVSHLSIYNSDNNIIAPISFDIKAGEILHIIGETGAGKSLLILAILGALPKGLHSNGKIDINHQRIDTLPRKQRKALWGRDVAILPQEPWAALSPLMVIKQQIIETYQHVSMLSRYDASAKTIIDLKKLNLSHAKNYRPDQISGGMCQRVAFLTAGASNTPLLLVDEATKGLDQQSKKNIISLLQSHLSNQYALINITHDMAVVKEMGGNVIVLKNGQMIEQGTADDVLTSPQQQYTRDLINAIPSLWQIDKPQITHDNILLSLRDISIMRGKKILFDRFNLTLKSSERIAISGASGIGKTSLLDMIAGMIPHHSGNIYRAANIGKTDIQKIYQNPQSAFPLSATIAQNLRDIARLHQIAWDDILYLLKTLNVSENLLNRYPSQVSGGELQRIALARAIVIKPKILLADEPTSRLDPITQKQVMDLISNITDEHQIAIILVTHDDDIAKRWAHQHIRI